MNSLFKNFGFASSTGSEGIRLAAAHSGSRTVSRGKASGVPSTVVNFPRRPDLSVLSETIPLFYIAQNKLGFWVAREAEGRCGGVFLLRRSAVRFVRRQSGSAGCAMMFLNQELELDIENEEDRLVEPIAALIDVATRRTPKFAIFVAMAIAEWRKLVAQIAGAFAGERRNRRAIERELFHGEYTLASKNDDDLPLP
jgi:hypothetical protein